MNNMSDELRVAIKAAKAGAKIALEYYEKEEAKLEIIHKADNTIVTIADTKTESVIKEKILSSFPGAEFICEEAENTVSDYKDVWIIDPIDGTFEFSRGINYWGILIAYARNEELTIGVCYFPALDTIIYAEKGKGVFVNGEKVGVSKVKSLKESTMAYTSIQHFKHAEEREVFMGLSENVRSSRCYNCAFSGFCIGSAKLDLYLTSKGVHIWDIAPFVTIIKEAGGKVTDWQGKDISIRNEVTQVIASNGLVHEEILAIINKTQ